MEYKVTGLVLRSVEYKEKDKLVVLYTMELGKITAVLKGVKSDKAKLKYAGQLFCFGEYMLSKTGDNFTIISCNQIDSFFDITKDYDKFACGGVLLEILEKLVREKQIQEQLFLDTIKVLNVITYTDVDPKIALLKFMLVFLNHTGYSPNLNHCITCGKPFGDEIYLHSTAGYFLCEKSHDVYPVPLTLLELLGSVTSKSNDDLKLVESDIVTINRTLKLVRTILDIQFSSKIRNLDKYLDEK